jgi:hypothetical protein
MFIINRCSFASIGILQHLPAMITIIIASANAQLLIEVKTNIVQTIGVPYEVLAFDNSNGERSICSIYNEGIKKAKFDLLCFMHEDIVFVTQGWGKIVGELFSENENLGVAGIAGSTYKSLTPSGWLSHTWLLQTEYSNLIQGHKYAGSHTVHHRRNPTEQNPAPVATVDGVWMCVKKNIAQVNPFDEKTFNKFHCYDIDFCISVGRRYVNMVTFDVLLHHYSDGNFDSEWIKAALKLHKKWNHLLPVFSKPFTKEQIRAIEDHNFVFFLNQLIKLGFSSSVAYRLLWQGNYLRRLGMGLFVRFFKYIRRHYKQNPKRG